MPLLITEPNDEFDRLRNALKQEINPRGIIEQMYVEDIAALVWEILRFRRSKAAIINLAFREALTEVITQLWRDPGEPSYEVNKDAEKLAREWFSDRDAKKQVADLLHEFNLDETTIEAEALRRSATAVERIDRLMASAEARRDKALVCIAQYRSDFGALLRERSDQLIDGKVLKLENAGSKERKPAA
jgi:hypothetical protein